MNEIGSTQLKKRHLARDIIEAIVLAAVLFAVLRASLQNTIVEGSSMEPNFVDRQMLLVNKWSFRLGEPARGDVIVFHAPDQADKDFIKRIIALPGEVVEIREGQVIVDGVTLDEPWKPIVAERQFPSYTVPANSYFVLGDNRPKSNDSRSWNSGVGAALDRDQIVGKAWISVWPQEMWGLIHSDEIGPARNAQQDALGQDVLGESDSSQMDAPRSNRSPQRLGLRP